MPQQVSGHRLAILQQRKADILVAPALVVYDYVLTLDQEVDTVWRRRFSVVSLLLVLTRWTLLLNIALNLAPPGPQVTVHDTLTVCF